ncbi:MAG: FtsW/RodA/SpoVE family cell cycle protein [Oscillospiraceae bacterium]|nr:FtsW/RodA/SpoVE family cell cycle protein [Oscillospiraceae bacterium]
MIYRVLNHLREAFRKCDLILLLLLVVTTVFGCFSIASATTASALGPVRYLMVQIGAAAAGVFCFVLVSSVDANFFSEHRLTLVLVNMGLLLLLIPFGTDNGSGNRSWLNFPFLPFDIQPAEICKITYVLIMASVMGARQNNLSSPVSIGHMLFHIGLTFGLNVLISGDMGVSLIFAFIFVFMTIGGGVSWFWYLLGGGVIAVMAPIAWQFFADYQKNRILILFDPNIDPLGIGPKYHSVRAMRSLTGGGLTGQGLFNGTRTQKNLLAAQHTDFIFAAIGEEMGFIGCAFAMLLLFLIIARCIWVGLRSPDYMRRLICFGAAGALVFQIIVNVGMCLGIMPVIGLTLPFISYGGSSLITLYTLLGLVSGVYARPTPPVHERYIRPPTLALRYY